MEESVSVFQGFVEKITNSSIKVNGYC